MWYQRLTDEKNFIEVKKLALKQFLKTEKNLKFTYKLLLNIQYLTMCVYYWVLLKRMSYGKATKRNS